MKKILLLALILGLTGCESTRVVDDKKVNCVGLDDDEKRLPGYNYEISTRNVIISAIAVEFLVPPIYTALEYTYCPYEKKD